VEPKVIGTFTATGDDGERYAVEIVRGYRRIDAGMRDEGGWVEDSLVDFRTDGGLEVGCSGEDEDGYFFVTSTRVRLTPDIPLADVRSMIDGRRT
jgi:hypothetical protein